MQTQIDERIEEIRRKLAARQGQPAYRMNVIALETELARLQAVREKLGE